jgi:hypothetical protein
MATIDEKQECANLVAHINRIDPKLGRVCATPGAPVEWLREIARQVCTDVLDPGRTPIDPIAAEMDRLRRIQKGVAR